MDDNHSNQQRLIFDLTATEPTPDVWAVIDHVGHGMTALMMHHIASTMAECDPAVIHDPHGDFVKSFTLSTGGRKFGVPMILGLSDFADAPTVYTDEQRRAIFESLPEACLFSVTQEDTTHE